MLRHDFRGLLRHARNAGKTRPALQFLAQCSKLCVRSRGVDFHTAIAEVADVTRERKPLGRAFHKKTKPYALHSPGDKVTNRVLRLGHGRSEIVSKVPVRAHNKLN